MGTQVSFLQILSQTTSLQADNSDRLLRVRLVQTYRLYKSTSQLPDNSARLLREPLVQTYLLDKSTSLLPDNADRLPRVPLVQTCQLHKSTSVLPDSLDRLPRVMFLRRVRMHLFNLVMILRTHKLYVIQVHQIMTARRRKCYLIPRIMARGSPKPTCCPGPSPGTQP